MFQKEDWRAALAEMRCLRSLCGCAMFMALNIVLNQFKVILSPALQISPSFLAIAACAWAYGPVLTGLAGMGADLIKFMLYPDGVFNPLWTLLAFVPGLLYGLVLYRRPVRPLRTFAAKTSVTAVVNLALNPLCMALLYGGGFIAYFSVRLVKNLVLLPLETAALFGLLKLLEKIGKNRFR